ncbi:M14 family zinc carboxypeptidase [Leptolyngbya sp. Heron Island J]|uniref:M14 family zinc carboxypeptidase n=1 Tax=Leptolyngbya sp. Heron Island J TaxID=1385935 RepID=UPI0004069FCF|nr:M14 family zinc carboxypeptidase [Leptolyngbya sp. Heron Island J]
MEWVDLKQLDTLIRQIEDLGACVEEIGISGEGRSIYGVTVGAQQATRTVVIVAGLHGAEVIAPLTAISILQTLVSQPSKTVRFCVVPVADPDVVARNANELPANVTLQALLNLNHQRDLEGYFTTDTYPECVAIRQWLAQFNRIDAYFSLHSAHGISPGLFFYVGSTSNPDWVNQVASQVAKTTPDWILLLPHDPTGLAKHAWHSGFFELELPQRENLNVANPGSSLAFVAHRFQPQYIGVPEMPLVICPALVKATLPEIEQCNRELKQTGRTRYAFKEIPLDTQLRIMENWVWSVTEQVEAMIEHDSGAEV